MKCQVTACCKKATEGYEVEKNRHPLFFCSTHMRRIFSMMEYLMPLYEGSFVQHKARPIMDVLVPEYSVCKFNPVDSKNSGMFHCPICGEMVIGGIEHPKFIASYQIKTEDDYKGE